MFMFMPKQGSFPCESMSMLGSWWLSWIRLNIPAPMISTSSLKLKIMNRLLCKWEASHCSWSALLVNGVLV
jgi:hypothetical protein